MDSNPVPADIPFTATVKADQLRFREVPRVDIRFNGARIIAPPPRADPPTSQTRSQ